MLSIFKQKNKCNKRVYYFYKGVWNKIYSLDVGLKIICDGTDTIDR